MLEINKIYNEDCLEGMKKIDDKSIDLICCDLPYGVLNRSSNGGRWDNIIPIDKLWEQYERIIKDNGVIVLYAQGMFTAKLMLSNEDMWRYNLIWEKDRPTGFLSAKKMPMRSHEDILVFYKNWSCYNPQMVYDPEHRNHTRGKSTKCTNNCYGDFGRVDETITDYKYPRSVIKVNKEHLCNDEHHPTQKPVELIEWLVKTYSNEGDLVLDNCMGSGTTAIACMNTNRNYIGFEIMEEYCKIAKQRIRKNKRLF